MRRCLILLILLALLLSAGPALAQPATPCNPGSGSWSVNTTTATLWICASDGQSWVKATAATPTTIPNLTGDVTSTGTATAYSATLPFSKGGLGACAATSATSGAMTVSMTTPCVTITPTGDATFNASGGVAGQIVVFSITTTGTTSRTLTFGTNFRKTGTLATGTVAARFFTVAFYCLDGTTWTEISRTAAQQ